LSIDCCSFSINPFYQQVSGFFNCLINHKNRFLVIISSGAEAQKKRIAIEEFTPIAKIILKYYTNPRVKPKGGSRVEANQPDPLKFGSGTI